MSFSPFFSSGKDEGSWWGGWIEAAKEKVGTWNTVLSGGWVQSHIFREQFLFREREGVKIVNFGGARRHVAQWVVLVTYEYSVVDSNPAACYL